MSDALAKPLTGQYTFAKSTDLLATAKNLRFGGSAITLTEATSAAALDASLGSVFKVSSSESFTLTISNAIEGQRLTLILISSGTVTMTVTGNGGAALTAVTTGNGTLYTIVKIGSSYYIAQSALGASS